jgi:hypothetical protein
VTDYICSRWEGGVDNRFQVLAGVNLQRLEINTIASANLC